MVLIKMSVFSKLGEQTIQICIWNEYVSQL